MWIGIPWEKHICNMVTTIYNLCAKNVCKILVRCSLVGCVVRETYVRLRFCLPLRFRCAYEKYYRGVDERGFVVAIFCKILLSLDDGFTFLTAIPNDNVQLLRTKCVPGQLNFRSMLFVSCKNACSWSVGIPNAIALGSHFIYPKKRD